jgi:hypothetical protein
MTPEQAQQQALIDMSAARAAGWYETTWRHIASGSPKGSTFSELAVDTIDVLAFIAENPGASRDVIAEALEKPGRVIGNRLNTLTRLEYCDFRYTGRKGGNNRPMRALTITDKGRARLRMAGINA